MTAGPPMRQVFNPRALCEVVDCELAAERIIRRLVELHRARSCGAWLFVSPDATAYLLHEEHTAAVFWLAEHPDWLVGFYRFKRGLPNPTFASVAEDLAEHIR